MTKQNEKTEFSRLQFNPSSELSSHLYSDALKRNMKIIEWLKTLLGKHYGLIPANKLSDKDIKNIVLSEIKAFVSTHKAGDCFDLNEASKTYSELDMIYGGKPYYLKASIGKLFCSKCSEYKCEQVLRKNGKPKKTSNGAAIYRILTMAA